MIKIYIVRHGETTWNAERRIQGRSDPELSATGLAQSLALLEQLKDRPIAALYTSTLQRAIQTAVPLAQYRGLPIQKRKELDEIAFGILEGKQLPNADEAIQAEWERFRENRLTYRIPGAENEADVAHRVRPFMENILETHRGREILIVGHRVVNRMLIGLLLGWDLKSATRIDQTNGCVYLIEKNDESKGFHFVNGEVREGILVEGDRVVLHR